MRFIVAAAFGALLAATPMSASASDRETYLGCLESAGAMMPVATIIDDDGRRLSGAYIFVEPDGNRTRGSLENGERVPSGEISFLWKDKYGEGRLFIRREEAGAGFTGRWSDLDGRGSYMWWGKRADTSALPRFDCGERGQT